MPEGQRPRGVTPVRGQGQWPRVPGSNGAGMAERSYPSSKVRGGGREELLHFQRQVRRLGGSTPRLRPGAVARRSNPTPEARGSCREEQPTSKEQWLHGRRRA